MVRPMSKLSSKVCTACRGDEDPLKSSELEDKMEDIDEGWELEGDHHIHRTFDFKDFKSALDFVNKIGELAEEQGHHPNIHLEWGEVGVKLYTHKIDGLHENDFIMAAKIDELWADNG